MTNILNITTICIVKLMAIMPDEIVVTIVIENKYLFINIRSL